MRGRPLRGNRLPLPGCAITQIGAAAFEPCWIIMTVFGQPAPMRNFQIVRILDNFCPFPVELDHNTHFKRGGPHLHVIACCVMEATSSFFSLLPSCRSALREDTRGEFREGEFSDAIPRFAALRRISMKFTCNHKCHGGRSTNQVFYDPTPLQAKAREASRCAAL